MLEHLKNWKLRSIVVRILIAFLLVVFPLCGAGIYMTYSSSSQMKSEIEGANESKLHFYYSHLKFELNRLTALVTEYTVDELLSTFSARYPIMTAYERASKLQEIHKKLWQVKETSPYIQDVVYYVPGIHVRVSAVEGISYVNPEDWQGLLGSMGNLQGALSQEQGDLYYLRSSPFHLDRVTQPDFLLGIKLSSEELQVRLEEFALSGESDITLAFGNRGDYVISSSGLSQITDDFVTAYHGKAAEGVIERLRTKEYSHYTIYDQEESFRVTASIPNAVVLKPIQVYSKWLFILMGLSAIVIVVFSVSTYRMIHRPLATLVRGFRRAEQGDMSVRISDTRSDEFAYLYSRFNEMMKHLDTLIEENYVQRIRTGEAELKHLQSQITPHFLYNSLFSIKQMAELDNVELIKEFSDYLGKYFRYVTRDAGQEATLKEELEHALVYVAIQQIRFGARIRTELEDLPKGCGGIRVPRVLLQPIIENVYEHGLGQKTRDGLLSLSFHMDKQRLSIWIEDNGELLSEEKLVQLKAKQDSAERITEQITGLLNVHERLRIKFGPEYGLELERSSIGGLCVKINIPMEEGRQE